MTRGRCGSLILHRMTFSFTTPRRFSPAHKEKTMSSRHSVLISGAPSGIGAVYADYFVRRGSDAAPTPLGRTQAKAAVQKRFRLTGQRQPLLEGDIRLEERCRERARI